MFLWKKEKKELEKKIEFIKNPENGIELLIKNKNKLGR